ncbi:hypothetical protein FOA52_009761 [Chlamydomonas sp. UWO 241]|nr:hypothetical protein FOA52_009761 [Chlamydomonas sp. UWO 241]
MMSVLASSHSGLPRGPQLRIVDAEASAEKGQDDCADNVTTDDRDESWISGRKAPAHIDLDLGRTQNVGTVDLLPYQVPTPAETCHRIWVGSSRDDMKMVAEVRQETAHHKWVTGVPIEQAARYLRIETVEHPGWVAWSGIKVYGSGDNADAK